MSRREKIGHTDILGHFGTNRVGHIRDDAVLKVDEPMVTYSSYTFNFGFFFGRQCDQITELKVGQFIFQN